MEYSKYGDESEINGANLELLKKVKAYGEIVELPSFNRFTFSRVTPSDKFTLDCCRCLALVLTGLDETNRPMSLLAYISPSIIDQDYRKDFRVRIQTSLQDFGKLTRPGTREAGIVGGYIGTPEEDGFWNRFLKYPLEYRQMVKFISSSVASVLEVESEILTPPKRVGHSTNVYLTTASRRLILVEQ